ncbi:MAG TPA: hypothetical protein VLB09_04755, partial [Nitrospiria bacterium]|nr:hypothetical protein [Nitrospiria bacterium]
MRYYLVNRRPLKKPIARVRVLALWVLFLPFAGGCFPKQALVEEKPLQTATLEELVGLQEERARSIKTLRALLRVHPERDRSFTASLKYIRDAGNGTPEIQVQGFNPFGRTVFELESANGDFRIRVSRNGR